MFLRLTLAAALLLTPLSGLAVAQTALQVVAVEVKPGQLERYVAAVKGVEKIMKRLEIDATVRVWQAMVAGDTTGTVVVGIEFADAAAWGASAKKLSGDAEWQKTLAGMSEMRTVRSNSLYQEIGK